MFCPGEELRAGQLRKALTGDTSCESAMHLEQLTLEESFLITW